LVWSLNQRSIHDIIIVDHLGRSEKWKNLLSLTYTDYLDKSEFISRLEANTYGDSIEAIFHLGACSATTELDADYLMENNYRYTLRLAQWRETHLKTRLIYASSAATYGSGEHGYSDDESKLHLLRPLNMYGYSKHLFDCVALKNGWLTQIAGLKFFNVFGPNENHKGDMRSVINKAYPRVRDEGVIELFKSYNSNYAHGEQLRDFIYIKDAVKMILFFFDNPTANGIYNIGTGTARSWNDIALSLCKSSRKEPIISYIDMPIALRNKYQYFTQADLHKLQSAGCKHICRSLEDAIDDYVSGYLEKDNLL
jgi:ADP-L-glycero-D-manno-heptose 6-epimerase